MQSLMEKSKDNMQQAAETIPMVVVQEQNQSILFGRYQQESEQNRQQIRQEMKKTRLCLSDRIRKI